MLREFPLMRVWALHIRAFRNNCFPNLDSSEHEPTKQTRCSLALLVGRRRSCGGVRGLGDSELFAAMPRRFARGSKLLLYLVMLQVLQTHSSHRPEVLLSRDALPSPPGHAGHRTPPPNVTISPPFLDFKRRALCLPTVEEFVVSNTAASGALTIHSCSSDTSAFQASCFQKQVVNAGDSAAVTVQYLPRAEGPTFGTLMVDTSVGGFVLKVQGEGIPSEYRVSPLVNLKVPIGKSPTLYMQVYNPHNTMLRIQEIFTNEGSLHLVLPKKSVLSGKNGDLGTWEAPPMTLIKVMGLTFPSSREGRHTGFVYVRTNFDNLIIPVDVKVLKIGVHRWPDVLDFGTLSSASETRELNITVLNSTPKPLAILNVMTESTDPQIQIVFRKNFVLLPNYDERVVASVVFEGKSEGDFKGKVIVRTNDSNAENAEFDIPYQARVLHGTLDYSQTNTTFAIGLTQRQGGEGTAPGGDSGVERWISVTNTYAVPVRLLAAVVENKAFEVVSFPTDTTLQPRAVSPPIRIRLFADELRDEALWQALTETALMVHTNISVCRIGLTVYNGALTLTGAGMQTVADDDTTAASASLVMDMGLVAVNDEGLYGLNITNSNPVPVSVLDLRFPKGKPASMSLKLLHTHDSAGSIVADASQKIFAKLLVASETKRAQSKRRSRDEVAAVIKPGQTVCLQVRVLCAEEEKVDSIAILRTSFETIEIRLRYVSMVGKLRMEPSRVKLPAGFPGKLVSEALYVTSSFRQPLTITGIVSTEPAVHAAMAGAGEHAHNISSVVLEPGVRTHIGYVHFKAELGPAGNYMAARMWPPEEQVRDCAVSDGMVRAIDLHRIEVLEGIWGCALFEEADRNIEATVTITSNMMKPIDIPVVGSWYVPDVLPGGRELLFPRTQLGQLSEGYLTVENPADTPMLAQLLMPRPELQSNRTKTNSSRIPTRLPCSLSATPQTCVSSSDFLLLRAHMSGIVVPPRSSRRLGPVVFVPKAVGVHEATVFLRTNLTLLDPVTLKGEGGNSKLDIVDPNDIRHSCNSGKDAGRSSRGVCDAEGADLGVGADNGGCEVLRLYAGERLTADGDAALVHEEQEQAQALAAGVRSPVVTKEIILSNTGSLPIRIDAVTLSDDLCDWNGLTLHTCGVQTLLQPVANYSLRLSFRPDCTMASTRVHLVVRTNLGTWRRPVLATVSPRLLEACYRAQSRRSAGGLLQGTSHAWVRLGVVVVVVCTALQVLRETREDRHRKASENNVVSYRATQARTDGSIESKEGSAGGMSGGHSSVDASPDSNQHYLAALAHLARLQGKDFGSDGNASDAPGRLAAGQDSSALRSDSQSNLDADTAIGRKGDGRANSSKDRAKVPPARVRTAESALPQAAAAPVAAETSSARRSASARSATTRHSDGNFDNAKFPDNAKVSGKIGARTCGVANKSTASPKAGEGLEGAGPFKYDADPWQLAGTPKGAKGAADPGKGNGSQVEEGRFLSATDLNAGAGQADGWFPPVTGSFGMVQDTAVFPLGHVPGSDAAASNGLALFGSLDVTPFALPPHSLLSTDGGLQGSLLSTVLPAAGSGWEGTGNGFFGTMPCDPAEPFSAQSRIAQLLGSSSDAGGDGDLDLVFPHMPVPDFPLED